MKTAAFRRLLRSIDEARAIRGGRRKPARVLRMDVRRSAKDPLPSRRSQA